jgi:hypothetical protein
MAWLSERLKQALTELDHIVRCCSQGIRSQSPQHKLDAFGRDRVQRFFAEQFRCSGTVRPRRRSAARLHCA